MAEKLEKPLVLPEFGSKSALEYYWASRCDLRLLHFVTDTVLTGDFASQLLADALEGKPQDEQLNPIELAKKNPGPRTQSFRQSRQELVEMFLSRAVDNFQVYIVEILREVLHKQPRILSASKQEITLGYVLEFDSIESLSRSWVEGKVTSLSYDGFGDLESWCQAKGIPLIVPDGQRDTVVELIAIRNLIVHNRCVVDDRYLKAAKSVANRVGEIRKLEIEELIAARDILDSVVRVTDSAITGKFSLPLVQVREDMASRSQCRWPKPKMAERMLKMAGSDDALLPPAGNSGVDSRTGAE